MSESKAWTLEQAVELCVLVESICPKFGCHVALTGGTLYKVGQRKDCDVLFYRIRQVEQIDRDGLFQAMGWKGIELLNSYGWCHKALFQGKNIDIFFPEEQEGDEYPGGDEDLPTL